MCMPHKKVRKYAQKIKISACIKFVFENRNKAHLKRKSWSLWRQPKNSHVSPNAAKGFWRRCSSLKNQHKLMKMVNQYEQTAGPDGGG